jgi:uncharacterized protein
VYDFAYLLDDVDVEVIESLCRDIEQETTAEIVVVTLENLDEYDGDINLARLRIFNDVSLDGVKGIGKAGKDNGILIVVAFDEREWGIEVGYGLEGDLTDSEAGRIGREIIAPYFRDGEYYYGLFIAVATIGEEIGYDVENFEPLDSGSGLDIVDILLEDDWSYFIIWLLSGEGWEIALAFIILIIVLIWLFGGTRRRGRSWWSGGGGGSGGGGRSGGGGARGRW